LAERLVTRRFALATVGNLVFFVAVTSFFSLPVHLQTLGASRAEIGRIMGSFGFAALFAIPATGALSDRFGRRRFMVAGALMWALLALGYLTVKSVGPAFYLLRLGQGLAFSLTFVATNAVIVDLAPPGALARAIALFGATTLASHALGPSLGEWVATRWGFDRMFELSAIVAVVAALAHARAPDLDASRATSSGDGVGMTRLALRRGATGALVAALGSAVTFGAAINFMPVFVRSRGFSSHAPFFIAYVVAAILVRLVAGGISDRMGHRRVGAIASIGFGAAAAGFAFLGHNVALLIALSFLFGVSHGVSYPAMNALFVEGAPATARGRAMALFNLSFNVGITLSAFVAGEVAERVDYRAMWLVAAAASVFGTAALLIDRPAVSAAADRAG